MSRFDIVQLDNDTWAVIDDQLPPPLYISAHRSREEAQAALAQERLIDAAPDLLETLKSIERSLPLIDLMSCGYLADEIRAVLAKAEGSPA